MTEELHDVLTRIADQAGPGPTDPTLWARARRARRDRRRRRAAAAVAAGLAAVTALTAVGIQPDRRRPQPVEQPDRTRSGPAIPSVIYGVPRDGGLGERTDLAVGQVSVAVANPTDVYVVTADDGVYHRVRLPGYVAASYDAVLPGIALSPDGAQLAYGWESAARRADGRPRRTGLRVVNLATGALWSAHLGDAFDVGLNIYAWDLRWSPDGRWLGASVAIHEVGGMEHWYILLEPSIGRVVEEMWHAKQWPDPPLPIMVSAAGRVAAMETDPRERLVTWSRQAWRTLSRDAAGLSTGRYSSDGRWLAMAGDGLESGISLVDTGSGAVSRVPLPPGGYPHGGGVDLLAWTGERQVLAVLRPGVGPDTLGPDADLALLTFTPGPDGPGAAGRRVEVDVVGQVETGQTHSVFSFATDLLSARSPTRDFDPPPFAP